jgi:hypothetical protein
MPIVEAYAARSSVGSGRRRVEATAVIRRFREGGE